MVHLKGTTLKLVGQKQLVAALYVMSFLMKSEFLGCKVKIVILGEYI
jgi:hypothetical protein